MFVGVGDIVLRTAALSNEPNGNCMQRITSTGGKAVYFLNHPLQRLYI
jgi:hypothetical protein